MKYEQFSDARYTKRTAVAKKNVHWLVQDLYGEWYASRSFLVGDPSVPSTVTTNDLSNNQNTEARAALEDMDWWVSFATTDPFEFVDDTDDALEQATAVTFTMRLKSPKRINTIRLIKDDCDEAGCYPLQPTGQTDTDYTLTSSFIGDHPSAAAQVTELLFAEDLSVTTADFQSKYIEITNAAGVQMAVWFDPLATTAATTLGQPLGIQASTSSLREFVTITVAANTNFNDGSAGDEKYIEVTDHTGREFAVWTDYNTDGTQPAAITAETADIASVAPTATTTTTIATDIKTAFTGISGFTDVFYVHQAGAVLQFTSKYPGFDVTDSVTDFAGGDLTAANTDGDTVNGDAAQVIDSSVVPLGSSAATVATQVQTKLAAANTAITGAVTVVEVATDNIVRITNDASGAADYVYTDLPTSVVTVSRTTTGATAEVDESTGTASVYTLTCGAAAAAGNWHNKYVEVSTLDGREFAVWVDVDGDGDWQDMPTAIKAAPSDIAIVTSVSDTDTGSTVATAVNTAFGTLTGFGDHFTTSVSSAVITFTYRGAGDPTAPATNDGTAAVWAETTTGVAKTATSAGAEDLYTVAESDICSNRGICDHDSGKCQCFEGHTGVACEDQTILV